MIALGAAPAEAAEVQALWLAAATPPPVSDPPGSAAGYAGLYAGLRAAPGFVCTAARDGGRLVGFTYGTDWRWDEQRYPWADELRERLGPAAAAGIEGSFAIYLLAVDPSAQGAGLGRRLLSDLLARAAGTVAWLQTADRETPALALYRATGWLAIGHGPDTPQGRPGLVLRHADQQ